MSQINILNQALINKIAAGEVIERPASVVKELIENSLDSGADKIKIEIEKSGKRMIKVTDNGKGMDEKDAELSYKPHATSKIKKDSDLFNINTLGFRGEALASIAQIANLKITTKPKQKEEATFLEVENQELIDKKKKGSSSGTIIEINNLFYNVPARKKYLKTDQVELSHITDIVTKYALINKDVSIKLIHNEKEIINSPKTDSLLNNITYIFGKEVAKNLVELNFKSDKLKIKGYISKPALTRKDKSDQYLYINKRAVKNKTISDTIYNAYHTLLFINRHPVFVLNVDIDPSEIDVNVHPTKRIIRLKSDIEIKQEVFDALRNTFKENSLIPEASLEKESGHIPIKDYSFTKHRQSTLKVKQKKESYPHVKQKTIKNQEKQLGPFYVLGQINKTYIIAENAQGLAIIDQHAAQERVNYEKFLKEFKKNKAKTQKLIRPKVIELTPKKYQLVKNNKKFFKELGFIFEDFGNNSIKLNTIPHLFKNLKSTLFHDIINQLKKEKTIDKETESKIIRNACRASVKAGDELTKPQMKTLLNDLEKTERPYTCPHGRPTIINLSISDLEKKFKRIGW